MKLLIIDASYIEKLLKEATFKGGMTTSTPRSSIHKEGRAEALEDILSKGTIISDEATVTAPIDE